MDVFVAVEPLAISSGFSVSSICEVLLVSRLGCYAWQHVSLSARNERDAELLPVVREIFWQHRRRCGARRIAAELSARGESCEVARAAKPLEMQSLRAIQPRSYTPRTTNRRHRLGYNANLLRERVACP